MEKYVQRLAENSNWMKSFIYHTHKVSYNNTTPNHFA